jgi:NAD(P)-dependent dehydrogenase (short-subunit alcohol dehydrogenase family)
VHYGRGAKEADGVVAEIHKGGGRADAIAMDLAAADGASKLARQARGIVGDRLDILVANAGVSKAATIEETTVEDFDKLFAVNVRAPFFLVQQILPIMSKGSSIVFLSSLAARAVVGTAPAYAATKGAVDTLVKHFASMLGARGIRVNAVAPGVVETDMSTFTKTEAGRDFALGMQALKRLAQPDDIGGVIAFLASEDARWITGDTIHVDGGSNSEVAISGSDDARRLPSGRYRRTRIHHVECTEILPFRRVAKLAAGSDVPGRKRHCNCACAGRPR